MYALEGYLEEIVQSSRTGASSLVVVLPCEIAVKVVLPIVTKLLTFSPWCGPARLSIRNEVSPIAPVNEILPILPTNNGLSRRGFAQRDCLSTT